MLLFLSVPSGFPAQLFVSRNFGKTYWNLTAVEGVVFLGMITGGIIMSTWGGFKNCTLILTSGLAVFGVLGATMADMLSLQWIVVVSGVILVLMSVVLCSKKCFRDK